MGNGEEKDTTEGAEQLGTDLGGGPGITNVIDDFKKPRYSSGYQRLQRKQDAVAGREKLATNTRCGEEKR